MPACHAGGPGSSPGAPAKYFGPLAQLARAPALHAGGHRFKSDRVHTIIKFGVMRERQNGQS